TKIGSAHTDLTPGDRFIRQLAATDHYFLPFTVYIRDNHVFLKTWQGPRDSTFRMGQELLSINQENVSDILRQLRSLLPGDGYSEVYKDYRLERNSFRGL